MKKIYLLISALFFLGLNMGHAQTYTDLVDMDATTAPEGEYPFGGLCVVGDTLYGMTNNGGANGIGVLFSYNTGTSTYTDLVDFNSGATPKGSLPYGTVICISRTLYGLTYAGGSHNLGTIFSYDIKTSTYTDLYDFSGGTGGQYPFGALTLIGNTLYGTSQQGGAGGAGNIFSFVISSSTYTDLYDFSIATGDNPLGSLTNYGGILYGLANYGGAYNDGVLFSFNPVGNVYNDRVDLWGTIDPKGSAPAYTQMVVYNNLLYGMTSGGGAHSYGVIFSFDPNTPYTYTDLYDFTTSTGEAPEGSLMVAGNTLYGMAQDGGSSNYGTLFSYDVTHSTFTNLYSFGGGSAGKYPTGSVVAVNGILYGMTSDGGTSALGNLFSFSMPSCTLVSTPSIVSDVACHGTNTGDAKTVASGGSSPYIYSWENLSTSGIASTADSTGAVLIGDSYLLTVTDNTGLCIATNTVTITQPAAALTVLATATDTELCTGMCTTLNSAPSGGTSSYTYSWSVSGTSSSVQVCPTVPTLYRSFVSDAHGCSSIDSVRIHVNACTGIDEISNANAVDIYPNPTNSIINIGLHQTTDGVLSIDNVLGQTVYSGKITGSNNTTTAVNISSLPQGVYLLKIQSDTQTLVKRIVKL